MDFKINLLKARFILKHKYYKLNIIFILFYIIQTKSYKYVFEY